MSHAGEIDEEYQFHYSDVTDQELGPDLNDDVYQDEDVDDGVDNGFIECISGIDNVQEDQGHKNTPNEAAHDSVVDVKKELTGSRGVETFGGVEDVKDDHENTGEKVHCQLDSQEEEDPRSGHGK